ncbi:DedA family protein [Tersicoccus phoenicis]|nr:DedA family protein [Tersicoccus phoenicis]
MTGAALAGVAVLGGVGMSSQSAVDGATGGIFGAVSRWVIDVMGAIGAPGAGLAVLLENLFPPIPSEVVLPLAGLAASQGKFGVVEAIAWTTAGSVIGAFALYGIGRALGHARIVRLAGRIPLVDVADVEKAVAWFTRHGAAAVFFGRFLPGVRSLISIPAGIERMPALWFGLLTLVGSGIWNTVFILAGYVLGDNWDTVLVWVDTLKYVIYAVIALLVIWFVVVKLRRRRARSR